MKSVLQRPVEFVDLRLAPTSELAGLAELARLEDHDEAVRALMRIADTVRAEDGERARVHELVAAPSPSPSPDERRGDDVESSPATTDRRPDSSMRRHSERVRRALAALEAATPSVSSFRPSETEPDTPLPRRR